MRLKQPYAVHASLLLASVIVGCGQIDVSRVESDPATAASSAMSLYDGNADGKLDETELKKSPALASATPYIDANRDGQISGDEINARIAKYVDLSNYVACQVQILNNRQPVPDAEVVFSPEPFMGSGFQTYAGKTSEGGTATLKAEAPSPGIAVGFYQVKIKTADGREHLQGVEVADDRSNANHLVFNL